MEYHSKRLKQPKRLKIPRNDDYEKHEKKKKKVGFDISYLHVNNFCKSKRAARLAQLT